MTDSLNPTDGTSFTTLLNRLLQRAQENGINVEGGWKCTIDGNGHSHWDVQITKVEYESD